MKSLIFLILVCSVCVLAITNEKRTQNNEPVDRSFMSSIFGDGPSSWFGGHGKRERPNHYRYGKPQTLKPMVMHHSSYEKPMHRYPVKLPHTTPQKYAIIKKVPYQVKVPVPRPVPIKVAVPKPYTVEKKVPVPVKVYVPHPYTVEKKVPYPVKVKVPIPQPYVVERKVPFEVKVPVEKPYIVHVPKPYPVYFEEHATGHKHPHGTFKSKPIPVHTQFKPEIKKHVQFQATPTFIGHEDEWVIGQDNTNNYYFEKKHAPKYGNKVLTELNHQYITPEEWSQQHNVGFSHEGSYELSIDTINEGLKSNMNKFGNSHSNIIKFEDDTWANPIDVKFNEDQHHPFTFEEMNGAQYRTLKNSEHLDDLNKSVEQQEPDKVLDAQHKNNPVELEIQELESLPQPQKLVQLNGNDNDSVKIPKEDTQVIYGQSNDEKGGFKPPTDIFFINPNKNGNVVQSSYNVGVSPPAEIKPIKEYPIYVSNINNGKKSVQAGYQVKEESEERLQNNKPGNYFAQSAENRFPRKLYYSHHRDMPSASSKYAPSVYYTRNDKVIEKMTPSVYYGRYSEMIPSLNRRYDYAEQPSVRSVMKPALTEGRHVRRIDAVPQMWAKPNMVGWTPIESRRESGPPPGDERS